MLQDKCPNTRNLPVSDGQYMYHAGRESNEYKIPLISLLETAAQGFT
jgi:hypothetical protein